MQEILVNVTSREIRVALLENKVLQEIYIERKKNQSLIGNIYKGRIKRLLPGIQAAFVDIGLLRPAFLHISDVKGFDPTKPQDIQDFFQPGQEILVQVYKDSLGSKGARLTMQFSLPARFLVLTPGVQQISFSQKITEEAEKKRLQDMVVVSEAGGYIFRTAATFATQVEIDDDKVFLNSLWKEISERAKQSKLGDCVYAELPLILRIVRDLALKEVEKIRIDDQEEFLKTKEFALQHAPWLVNHIEYYQENRPIFDIFSVEEEIQKALERKIKLKSGGHLVFDQTEAMTTIDVNSGSFIGKNASQTILTTNLEAANVIARQVRLRNLGGIIIIDFIDLDNEEDKQKLLQTLVSATAKDSVRIELSELSRLGLVQMTRKRTRESLERILCVTCPLCQKRGSIKSEASVCYDILRDIKRFSDLYSWQGFLIVAAKNIIDFLMEKEADELQSLELKLGKPIKLRADTSFTQEDYDILPL